SAPILTAAIGFDESGPISGLGLRWIMMSANGNLPIILQKAGGGRFHDLPCLCSVAGCRCLLCRESGGFQHGGRAGRGSQRTNREFGHSVISGERQWTRPMYQTSDSSFGQ